MVDKNRHGDLVYSDCGKFKDLENGESGYHAVTRRMLGVQQGGDLSETLKKVERRVGEEEGESNEGEGLKKGVKSGVVAE